MRRPRWMPDRNELIDAAEWAIVQAGVPDNYNDPAWQLRLSVEHLADGGIDLGDGLRIAIVEPIPDVGTSMGECIWLHLDPESLNASWVDTQDAVPVGMVPLFRMVTPDPGEA